MKGSKKTKWIFCWVALSTLLNATTATANSIDQVIIVKSSDNSYFNQTIKTLVESTSGEIVFHTIGSENLNSEIIKSNYKNSLFVSLGIRATSRIIEQFPNHPVISAYSTQEQIKNLKLRGKHHLAILLDQPLERYLAFSHYLIQSSRPGMVNEIAIELNSIQRKTLKRLNIDLSQYQPEGPDDLLTTIRFLKNRNDALLMLPNQRLYNRNTLKSVLLTAYRNRMPVISYSPAYVKSGALASIYSSPEDIGRHIGELLVAYQKNPSIAEEPSVRYAGYYSIKTNRRVAHSLGIKLPEETDIRRFLSEVLP